jgi:hypothetical protein
MSTTAPSLTSFSLSQFSGFPTGTRQFGNPHATSTDSTDSEAADISGYSAYAAAFAMTSRLTWDPRVLYPWYWDIRPWTGAVDTMALELTATPQARASDDGGHDQDAAALACRVFGAPWNGRGYKNPVGRHYGVDFLSFRSHTCLFICSLSQCRRFP